MTHDLSTKLVIAVSSRTLFDLNESHHIYENEGVDAYAKYQIDHENITLQPGSAFGFVNKMLKLRDPHTQQPFVEVILLSRNSSDTGLRIFNSIQQHELDITRAAFTNGASPYRYASAFNAHLYLSTHVEDVQGALQAGIAAATIESTNTYDNHNDELRIAFDGDAVLFSDEAEIIYKQQGLDAFQSNEVNAADKPLADGPFKGFLHALHQLQRRFTEHECPIRTGLVTARNAPAHERVIRTLREWDIRIDEALFLGGLSKGEFLKAFDADIYFDDQKLHCANTASHVTTGHVPHGVSNQ